MVSEDWEHRAHSSLSCRPWRFRLAAVQHCLCSNNQKNGAPWKVLGPSRFPWPHEPHTSRETSTTDSGSLPGASRQIALGKAFAECGTRQRTYGKKLIGKYLFAECLLSSTRQRLCREPRGHSAKKSDRHGAGPVDGHSAKIFYFF